MGVDEIKVPLIGLGLVDSVEEVDRMLSLVDEDGSGQIEFDEFLDIILNKSGDAKTRVITEFFKNLTGGKYNTGGLPFPNWVLKEQRKHLMNAIREPSNVEQVNQQKKGVRILNAIRKMRETEEVAKANERDNSGGGNEDDDSANEASLLRSAR